MSQKRSLSFFNRKREQLSIKPQPVQTDLALKIIEKEIELEKTWDPKVIHELMTFYSKVIEQYEQNNNPKYADFQDRMHNMLIRPQVIAALQRFNSSQPTKSDETHKPVIRSHTDRKDELDKTDSKPKITLEKLLVNPTKSSNPMAIRKAQAEMTRKTLTEKLSQNLEKPKSVRKVNCIIERQHSTSRESANKAVADFKSQESGLERRKASRKLSQIARSMTMNSSTSEFTQSSKCDSIGNGDTKASILWEESPSETAFEKKLEEIMEKNYTARAMKIAEIKVKYEQQIEEISGTGGLMDMLVKQMKVNMQEEINKVTAEFDAKRREDIRKLKEFSN